MVTRHVVPLNSFASVRGIKHSVTEGKTPELSIEQARKLFRSIDISNVVGLRDRALLGVLAYTGRASVPSRACALVTTKIPGSSVRSAFMKKVARVGTSRPA
jgi:site-specific recombinase XerD